MIRASMTDVRRWVLAAMCVCLLFAAPVAAGAETPPLEHHAYILLYNLAYMADDAAMVATLGILLFVKPEWLTGLGGS
jgi:hypothetical protein